MAIYLYNLGFSINNYLNGNFNSDGSGVNASDAWFEWNGQSNPQGLNVYQSGVQSIGVIANWTALSSIPSTFNANGSPAGPDYVFVRIFNADGTPGDFLVCTTVVLGHGSDATSPITSDLQSPFICNANDQAAPVLNADTLTTAPGAAPQWPGPITDANPINPNSSWTYCLGQINGPTNDYSMNVGASVYVVGGAGPGQPPYYFYGIDPKMHVSGMGQQLKKDEAA
jgi:hypothetical protein